MRLVLLSLAVLAVPVAAQDVLQVEPELPVVAEPVRVTFSEPVDSVTVTYRPGSVTATSETFTPGAAEFTFTPSQAGVVSVRAGESSQNLSVRFRDTPALGLLVMIGAGLILFGGAAISLRALLSDGHRIEVDPTLRPDT